jgi:hypothetical protein
MVEIIILGDCGVHGTRHCEKKQCKLFFHCDLRVTDTTERV